MTEELPDSIALLLNQHIKCSANSARLWASHGGSLEAEADRIELSDEYARDADTALTQARAKAKEFGISQEIFDRALEEMRNPQKQR